MRPTLTLTLTIFLAASALASARADEPKQIKTIHPRSLEQIKKDLAAIYKPIDKDLDAAAQDREKGLQRIKAYRYLAEVPNETLTLDDNFNKLAQAGAA